MKLCKNCLPIMGKAIDERSEVKSVITKDHEDCDNCGFSHNDMSKADNELKRLRATNVDEDNFDKFVKKELKKSKQLVIKNW